MNHVTCFEAARSWHFRKTRRKIQHKGELWQKVINIYKHSANSRLSDAFYRLMICNSFLRYWFFNISKIFLWNSHVSWVLSRDHRMLLADWIYLFHTTSMWLTTCSSPRSTSQFSYLEENVWFWHGPSPGRPTSIHFLCQ